MRYVYLCYVVNPHIKNEHMQIFFSEDSAFHYVRMQVKRLREKEFLALENITELKFDDNLFILTLLEDCSSVDVYCIVVYRQKTNSVKLNEPFYIGFFESDKDDEFYFQGRIDVNFAISQDYNTFIKMIQSLIQQKKDENSILIDDETNIEKYLDSQAYYPFKFSFLDNVVGSIRLSTNKLHASIEMKHPQRAKEQELALYRIISRPNNAEEEILNPLLIDAPQQKKNKKYRRKRERLPASQITKKDSN